MSLPEYVSLMATVHSPGGISQCEVPVCAEYRITLMLNGSPLVRMACSGSDLESLATGYLISTGIIDRVERIKSIAADKKKLTVSIKVDTDYSLPDVRPPIPSITVAGGGGRGRRASKSTPAHDIRSKSTPLADFTGIKSGTVMAAMQDFLSRSELYRLTFGAHSAALYGTDGQNMAFFDDIGRHHAVDKIIGAINTRRIPPADTILLCTCRLSSKIVLKILSAGLPAIASKASPTSLAIEIARKEGLLMIGNVRIREKSFRIYCGDDRVLP